jgi:hypothetical protein
VAKKEKKEKRKERERETFLNRPFHAFAQYPTITQI